MKVQEFYSICHSMATPKHLKKIIILSISIFLITSCKKSNIVQENQPAATASGSNLKINRLNANKWYDMFYAYETTAGGGNAYYNNTDAAILAWQESYMLNAYLLTYQVTKDVTWLNKLTTHFDAMLTNTYTHIGYAGYKDWETDNYSNGTGKFPYMVCDGMICLPIARFIRLVNQNSTSLSAFQAKANQYQTFIETYVVPKWTDPTSYVGNCWVQLNSTTGYFKEPSVRETSPTRDLTPLPYNMMNVYATMLWTMYDVNGIQDYLDKAKAIATYFKNGLVTNGSGYKWKYINKSTEPDMENTSHSNLDIDLVLEAYNHGMVFNNAYMQNFRDTYTTMWNGSTTNPLVHDAVDGNDDYKTPDYEYTEALNGWTSLAQFGSRPWDIAADQFRGYNPYPTGFANANMVTQIMYWDPLKVVNQGFEYKDCADSTWAGRWTKVGTASASTRDNTNQASGKYCAKIVSPGNSTSVGFFQTWTEWEPTTSYTITFDVKVLGSSGAKVFMLDTNNSNILASQVYTNTSWATQTITFTTQASTIHILQLHLENANTAASGTIYFDNIKIKKTGDAF